MSKLVDVRGLIVRQDDILYLLSLPNEPTWHEKEMMKLDKDMREKIEKEVQGPRTRIHLRGGEELTLNMPYKDVYQLAFGKESGVK